MADVFISYASEDRERVRPLAEALKAKGVSVWWDRALIAGDDYAQVIKRELEAAKAVIVVWSSASTLSPFVRDEATLARDRSRLVPILFDRVDLPLGFGALHTEDLTGWNGAPNAPQVQILVEAIKARLEGRAPDAEVLQGKRRRVRIGRWVSMASAVGGLAALAALGLWGYRTVIDPPAAAPIAEVDPLAQLLQLVREGKISGEEAVRLAEILQTQAFADIPGPPAEAPPAATAPEQAAAEQPASAGGETPIQQAEAPPAAQPAAQAALAAARDQSMDDARALFKTSADELLRHPDPAVRDLVVTASRPQTRQEAFKAIWARAQQGGPEAAALWRLCASLMTAVGDPRAAEALQYARASAPQDRRIWSLLSVAYGQASKAEAAAGAALVAEGLKTADAPPAEEDRKAALEAALPLVEETEGKAIVLGELGDKAAAAKDWDGAAKRYEQALEVRQASGDPVKLAAEAEKLAQVYLAARRPRQACRTLQRAVQDGAAIDAELQAKACADPTPKTVRPQNTIADSN